MEDTVAQELWQHVEAVLMIDANGKIVEEYVKERASKLNDKEFMKLIDLMNDIVRSWSPPVRAESSDSGEGDDSIEGDDSSESDDNSEGRKQSWPRGLLARLRAFFSK